MGLFNFFKKKKVDTTFKLNITINEEINKKILNNICDLDLGVLNVFSKDRVDIMGEYSYVSDDLSEDEFVENLSGLINNFNLKFAKYKDNFKNYILLHLLNDAYMTGSFGCGLVKDYLIDENNYSEEECNEICEKVINEDIIKELDYYYKHGLTYNSNFNAEDFIKENLTFFNYERFISSLTCEVVTISFNYNKENNKLELTMSLQFSDKHISFYCSAYEVFDENLMPLDWHNF